MLVINTQMELVRAANAVMAAWFFPRAKDWLYPWFCGSYQSNSLVEPFAIPGAAPLLKRFDNVGYMKPTGVKSFTMQVPNILMKNMLDLNRSSLEGDQIGAIMQYLPQMGLRLAETPDYMWVSRLLNGHKQSSVTDTFEGTTYTQTIDGVPYFSASHDTGTGTSQSNIVSGHLPSTLAALLAQDVGTTASQLAQDMAGVLNKCTTFTDNQGALINPSFDTRKNLIVVVPTALLPAATLVFKSPNSIIGGVAGGVSLGATTNVMPTFVKDVISSGMLAGCPDVINGGTASPSAATCWYAFIVNDLVKPFYLQVFRPRKQGEFSPPGWDPEAMFKKAISAVDSMGLSRPEDAASIYASTIVEHNLAAVGPNATRDVVTMEKHFISDRYRGNVCYGPWTSAIKVVPSGVSS